MNKTGGHAKDDDDDDDDDYANDWVDTSQLIIYWYNSSQIGFNRQMDQVTTRFDKLFSLTMKSVTSEHTNKKSSLHSSDELHVLNPKGPRWPQSHKRVPKRDKIENTR